MENPAQFRMEINTGASRWLRTAAATVWTLTPKRVAKARDETPFARSRAISTRWVGVRRRRGEAGEGVGGIDES